MAPITGFADLWPYVVAALCGYLVGSVPFGLILTRLAGLGDIRAIGSGNIGATNVLRTGSKSLALLTLFLDIAKGAVPPLVASQWGLAMALVAGGGAVLGHVFPAWLGLRGGKGVATSLGVMAALAWPVALLCFATWLVVAGLFRYVSLASVAASAAAPLYAWWVADAPRAGFIAGLALVVILRHATNIRRLLAGTEPRLGERT